MTINKITLRASQSPTVCLRAVGDVNFSRGIGKRIEGTPGFDPLPPLKELLGNAQLGIFNLECNPVIKPQADTLSKMIAPAIFLGRLREEFNIAGIANNHILDAGNKAFIDVIDLLRAYDFEIVGGGKNSTSAGEMRIIHINSIRIGIIACADFVRTPHGHGNRAGKHRPGVSIYNPRKIVKRVIQYSNEVNVMICSLHTGLEFHSYPDPALMKNAHALIDAGADMILVHHAHVRQGIEVYGKGLIAYGMGNFIFDTEDPYMQQKDVSTDIGLILDASFDQSGITECRYWLSRIDPDGRTSVILNLDQYKNLYDEQLVLNQNLLKPHLVRREWKKICVQYLKNRYYSIIEAIRMHNIRRLFHLVIDLRRRENRRWIAGLFSR